MIRIGVELNGVLRNLNKQINVCWEKKTGNLWCDEDEVDEHDLKTEMQWKTIQQRNSFFYEEYPFELFGCTPCMSNMCTFALNEWAKNAENFEKDDIEFVIFSPFENGLTIKATLFFCSKFLMFREFKFPKKAVDIWNDCDVVITANNKIAKAKPNGKVLLAVKNKLNDDCQQSADKSFDSIEKIAEWDFDFNHIFNLLHNIPEKEDDTNEIEDEQCTD